MGERKTLILGFVVGAILAFAAVQGYQGYVVASQFGMGWNSGMPSGIGMGQGTGNHMNGQCTGMAGNVGNMMNGNQMNHEQYGQYMGQHNGTGMSQEQCQQMMY